MSKKIPGLAADSFDNFYRRPILGVDEVGTGAIAGPMCVGGVVLPDSKEIHKALLKMGLRDSKVMAPTVRKRVADFLQAQQDVWISVSFASHKTILELGHTGTLNHLFEDVMAHYLRTFGSEGTILLDGPPRKLAYTHTNVVKGDNKSLSIMAAACVAKASRDDLMTNLSERYPGYSFEKNFGYCTPEHVEGLEKLGACAIHRTNTKTVARLTSESPPAASE
jgi:ribonuclease HII